jgi:5-methylthioadenosine/S-adenosylhomocysteine deaminase
MKTLIRNTTAYLGENFDRHDNIDILIEKNKITRIGKRIQTNNVKIVDGKDFFVTPGFINAHFHPTQQLNRALGVGLSHDEQMDLLHATDKIKRPSDKYWMSYIAILEGLKAGTTCFQFVGSEIESQIPVFEKLGVRGVGVLIPKDLTAKTKKKEVRAKKWDTNESK